MKRVVSLFTLLLSIFLLASCGNSPSETAKKPADHEHIALADAAVSPTCTESGLTAGSHCSICGESLHAQKEIPPLGHSEYTNNGLVPTCTETGYSDSSHCTVCGELLKKEEQLPALGHTIQAEPALAPTCTTGGYPERSKCTVCNEILAEAKPLAPLGHTPSDWIVTDVTEEEKQEGKTATKHKECTRCLTALTEELPLYFDTKLQYTREGNIISFGSYPQTQVTDASLIPILNSMAGALPTATDRNNWTSYNYYKRDNQTGMATNKEDYAWYIDIQHNGEKYRGVYFSEYRSIATTRSFYDKYDTNQIDNGYHTGTTYWFLYEPIRWRILEEQSGKALLLCESILDCREYHFSNSDTEKNGTTVYANNYADSSVRAWLNDSFYHTAFDSEEKAMIPPSIIDNGASSVYNSEYDLNYICENTSDHVSLPSYSDLNNTVYGFGASIYDADRQKTATDYAKCQGIGVNRQSDFKSYSNWWMRSPVDFFIGEKHYGSYSWISDFQGVTNPSYCCNYNGIAVTIWILL